MDITRHFEKGKNFWILFAFCMVFVLLRFPSLYEPVWYSDEGIYQSIGMGLRAGRQFYTEVWDNKPPLLFIIYALAGGDQFAARVLSLLFGLGAVIAFYLLVRKIYSRKIPQIISTLVFVLLFGLPTIEGNIANSENFMLFPILVAVNLLYPLFDTHIIVLDRAKKYRLLAAGIVLSLSFLIKIVAVFDLAAFIVFSIFMYYFSINPGLDQLLRRLPSAFYKASWVMIGFIAPVFLSIIYFTSLGVLPQYLDAAFGRNVDYVGWANYLIIPQGMLYLRILILAVVTAALFYKRSLFSKRVLFILIWLIFSLFNAFFSNRPYIHYQLMVLPSFALLIGQVIAAGTPYKRAATALLAVLVVTILNLQFDNWSISKTFGYYSNYLDLINHKKDYVAYQSFFDLSNPKEYMIAEFIKKHTKTGDIVFLWGNSSQIYPLSKTLPPGRYADAYHIGTNKKAIAETEQAIKKNHPKYIIITPDEPYFPFNLSGYTYVLTVEDAHIYERTF